jgi:methylglyoxal synthase
MKDLPFLRLATHVLVLGISASAIAQEAKPPLMEYKLLATSKTSTMEKELNQAADAGFQFEGVMGGDTAFGGKEVVSILSRPVGEAKARYQYKLLATNKTGTMQKEMAEGAASGFVYRGQTVTDSLFGGREVIVIMERDHSQTAAVVEYKLLATSKTGTMQKELSEVAAAGYRYRGVTVAATSFGGSEVVVITERALGTK